MKKVVIGVLAFSVILGFLFWKFAPNFLSKKEESVKDVTLTIYGLWEEEKYIRPALDEYKKLKPNVTIEYNYQSSINYQRRVQTQITNGEGPDIFMIHNSWLPVFLKAGMLSQAPTEVISIDEYGKTFYPIAKKMLSKDKDIYAIPRGVDGLAMFYNEELLKNAGVGVPKNWEEFRLAATKVTVIDSSGVIKTAGAGIGATGNVDHWSDIIGLLFLQQPGADFENPNNTSPVDPNVSPGADIVRFYTNFVIDPRQKVWDTTLDRSTNMFTQGKLAFYFAPSWRAFELRTINPELKFKTAPVPQLPGKTVSWGTFWAYAVSSKSQSQKEAWEFLKFFTSKETQKLLYEQASQIRLFGLPYSRVELQSELSEDPIVGAFVTQAPAYDGWYLSSETRDQGINDQIIKYYEDAINSVLKGMDPKTALDTTAQGVKQVLDTFLSPASSSTPSQ